MLLYIINIYIPIRSKKLGTIQIVTNTILAETFAFLSFCAFLNVIIILIKENKKKLILCQINEQT